LTTLRAQARVASIIQATYSLRTSNLPSRMNSSATESLPRRMKIPLSTIGTSSRSACADRAPSGETAASITVVYPRRA